MIWNCFGSLGSDKWIFSKWQTNWKRSSNIWIGSREGCATSRFHRLENSTESLPTILTIGCQTVCPGRLQFPICFSLFLVLPVFCCCFSHAFFSFFLLSLWRSLSSCHSAFHKIGLVFERTHRSCFLFLQYPATTGPFVGWSPCCLRCSKWSLYSQPLLR